ncbi:hypothetical protein EZI54_06805 [Marinobacter halodurans]|uniref:Uncharacterized protein n=1 Tax=Marinobacter halodurans TaxID=2528979 RepID=A0ABY1ZP38_9GAMM|nr:hypothetical protein [Marinobacter halodurans]TBW57360.1 hypothetical protein EZI54_06805 [Marinobacter halodurans]
MTEFITMAMPTLIDPRVTPASVCTLSTLELQAVVSDHNLKSQAPYLSIDGKAPISSKAHRWLGPTYTQICSLLESSGEPDTQTARQLAAITQRILNFLKLDHTACEKQNVAEALTGNDGSPNRRVFGRYCAAQDLITIQLARPKRFHEWLTLPVGTGNPAAIDAGQMPKSGQFSWVESLGVPALIHGACPRPMTGTPNKILSVEKPCWRTFQQWTDIAEMAGAPPAIDLVQVYSSLKTAASICCQSQYAEISPSWALALEAAFTAQTQCQKTRDWLAGTHDVLIARIAALADELQVGRPIGMDTGRLYLEAKKDLSQSDLRKLAAAVSGIGAYVICGGTIYAHDGDTRNALTPVAAKIIRETQKEQMESADKFMVNSHSLIAI